MKLKNYSMGFTAGALLYKDCIIISALYLELSNWDHVKKVVLDQNLLQIRTLNASRRIYSETQKRLMTLSLESIKMLTNGTKEAQIQLIWYSICKRYRFMMNLIVQRTLFLILYFTRKSLING